MLKTSYLPFFLVFGYTRGDTQEKQVGRPDETTNKKKEKTASTAK